MNQTHDAAAPLRMAIDCRNAQDAQTQMSGACIPLKLHDRNAFDISGNAVIYKDLGFIRASSMSGLNVDILEPFDGYAFACPLSGSMSLADHNKNNVNLSNSKSLFFDAKRIGSTSLSSRSVWTRVTITSHDLHDHLSKWIEQPVTQRIVFNPAFEPSSSLVRLIITICDAILDRTQGPVPLSFAPAVVASLKNSIIMLFLEGVPHNYSKYLNLPQPSLSPRHLRLAVNFMEAHLAESLTLEDIAAAAQVSPRSLQLAFRKNKNQSPMEFLRRMRLENARRELMDSNAKVTVCEVAYRWGFAHLGLFSTYYFKAFGEKPSQTLKLGRKP